MFGQQPLVSSCCHPSYLRIRRCYLRRRLNHDTDHSYFHLIHQYHHHTFDTTRTMKTAMNIYTNKNRNTMISTTGRFLTTTPSYLESSSTIMRWRQQQEKTRTQQQSFPFTKAEATTNHIHTQQQQQQHAFDKTLKDDDIMISPIMNHSRNNEGRRIQMLSKSATTSASLPSTNVSFDTTLSYSSSSPFLFPPYHHSTTIPFVQQPNRNPISGGIRSILRSFNRTRICCFSTYDRGAGNSSSIQSTIVDSSSSSSHRIAKAYLNVVNVTVLNDKHFKQRFCNSEYHKPLVEKVLQWLHQTTNVIPYDRCLKTFRNEVEYYERAAQQQETTSTTNTNSSLSASNVPRTTQVGNKNKCLIELKKQQYFFLTSLLKDIVIEDDENQKKIKKMRRVTTEIVLAAFYGMIHYSAKHRIESALPIIWTKIKEMGFHTQRLLQTVLYLAAPLPGPETGLTLTQQQKISTRSRQRKNRYNQMNDVVSNNIVSIFDAIDAEEASSSTATGNEKEEFVDLPDEVAIYYDLIHEPTEQTTGIRVRFLVGEGQASAAEQVLVQFEQSQPQNNLKFRAYRPIIGLYLHQNQIADAFRLLNRLKVLPNLVIDVELYVTILATLAERGIFLPNAPPVPGLKELGYDRYQSGPGLYNVLVKEMAEMFRTIPEESSKRILDAFKKMGHLYDNDESEGVSGTDGIASSDTVVASQIKMDPYVGICPRTGVKLRLIQITEVEKAGLRNSLCIAADQSKAQVVSSTKPSKKPERGTNAVVPTSASVHLNDFGKWLNKREGYPFTTFIDGANLGHHRHSERSSYNRSYMINFSFAQIKFVVEKLLAMGENPLVILPYKFKFDTFSVPTTEGYSQSRVYTSVTQEARSIRSELTRRDRLYFVPDAVFDDYALMYASVCDQNRARQMHDIVSLDVPTDDPSGRWAGSRPVIITNDKLRDHTTQLLEKNLIQRWSSNYVINYDFYPFTEKDRPPTQLKFGTTEYYSHEIQCNTDENGVNVWHFPLDGTDDEWVCIRIPNDKGEEGVKTEVDSDTVTTLK